MFRHSRWTIAAAIAAWIAATQVKLQPALTQEQAGRFAWTLDEAIGQLQLHPRDPYLQYVVMQLGARAGNPQRVRSIVDDAVGNSRRRNPNTDDVDLMSLFSGALAVQESLQLDAMMDEPVDTNRQPARSIKDLVGPSVKSHPWSEMLAGRKPAISPLALCVPADYLYVQFRDVGTFLNAMRLADHWGAYVVNQNKQAARTSSVTARIKRQLAVETIDALIPVYNQVVDRIGVAASDLFVREGTDITLLIQAKQAALLRAQMDQFLAAAEKAEPGATRTDGEYLGVRYTHVTTADRALHVFSAYPRPDLHVRSNSWIAFQRVLGAITGTDVDGRAVPRLGASDEFAFIRTIMTEGAAEEDAFVYLSDPFIRNLVGPQSKLTQRRRFLCYNNLRVIGHAALLHTTETGKKAASLADLAASRCLPDAFGKGVWVCPDGGAYALNADGTTAACSHHGHAGSLVPCCEIPLSDISESESNQYSAFLARYNQYWRTYFDPIAIRLQLTPKRYRVETIVLPLIDNSIYSNLAEALGGPPEPLDQFPIPQRNIFTMAVKLDKPTLFEKSGLREMDEELQRARDASPSDKGIGEVVDSLKQVGVALHTYHQANRSFPPPPGKGSKNRSELSWRVHLLPYLEQSDLYEQFHLDEPWDSPHNKTLVAKMPRVYCPDSPEIAAQGKSTIAVCRGDGLFISNDGLRTRLETIRDGTSDTIMAIELDDAVAEIWTKADGHEINLEHPTASWRTRSFRHFALMSDGAVLAIPATTSNELVAGMLTRAGKEPIDIPLEWRSGVSRPPRSGRWHDDRMQFVEEFGLVDFLARGIGEQISLNICDADPLVDFNVSRFLGMGLGSFSGGGGVNIFDEEVVIPILALSLNVPIYAAISVQDTAIVDRTLDALDDYLARLARQEVDGPGSFFEISQDFYRFEDKDAASARSYAFQFGPVKWRFCWARIGNGLYVASKPFILEDLMAIERERREKGTVVDHDAGPPAHAMVRVRPTHWNQVLGAYRIGWSENQRIACLHNLGPLSGLSRAFHAEHEGESPLTGAETLKQLDVMARRTYDATFFCPANGTYVVGEDGKSVTCTVHGSAHAPRQPFAPGAETRLGSLLAELRDVTVALSFLEDGLHAVLTIEKE